MLWPCPSNPAWFSKLFNTWWSEGHCVPGSRLLCAEVSPVDSLVCLISEVKDALVSVLYSVTLLTCLFELSCGNLTWPVYNSLSLWWNCLFTKLSAGLGLKTFCILSKCFISFLWCLKSFHSYSVCMDHRLWIYICATDPLRDRNRVTPTFCLETEAEVESQTDQCGSHWLLGSGG